MSVQLPPYRPIKHRSGLKVMGAAFHALLMRELQTRFGGYRLGYLWAPLEVLFQVLIFLVIFGTIRERLVPGMDYSLFLVAGMVPFRMFQKIATRALGAVEANKGLLMYRSIKHIDVIIARSFLELVIYFFTSILLLLGLAFFNIYASLENLHIVLFCWITLFIFSFGVALIMMVVGHYGGEISKVITIFFTILYFASGIIFPIHIVPEPYFSYLLYNPLIHNIELMRHAFAPNYPAYHIDIGYFLKWMFAVNFLGLLLYKYAERDMLRSK
ncbi:ABC transporter permease [Psychrobacter sp. AOP22-C1-22]|uniref:ABC transporter permease n=1 Tax=unclassified Psychrobacter TaxID=196806 RepID=UPI0017881234|nr:ABC transporter permease [Psychrobacter sp. FME6]MBE0405512.1 ABC transporter permease [Psychrobacter sp. FME6]